MKRVRERDPQWLHGVPDCTGNRSPESRDAPNHGGDLSAEGENPGAPGGKVERDHAGGILVHFSPTHRHIYKPTGEDGYVQATDLNSKIELHERTRILTSSEASWWLQGFPRHHMTPSVATIKLQNGTLFPKEKEQCNGPSSSRSCTGNRSPESRDAPNDGRSLSAEGESSTAFAAQMERYHART